jgi:Tfp pilus assembly protein PilX
MNAKLRRRAGMALPMVLGAIILIGTLVAGVMYLATQDYRVGANTLNETRVEAAAEMGLNRVLTDWDLTKNTTMQTGDTLRKL